MFKKRYSLSRRLRTYICVFIYTSPFVISNFINWLESLALGESRRHPPLHDSFKKGASENCGRFIITHGYNIFMWNLRNFRHGRPREMYINTYIYIYERWMMDDGMTIHDVMMYNERYYRFIVCPDSSIVYLTSYL